MLTDFTLVVQLRKTVFQRLLPSISVTGTVDFMV